MRAAQVVVATGAIERPLVFSDNDRPGIMLAGELPADTTGPARFSQRFRWLRENAFERWVQWRCEKIRDLYAEIARHVQARRGEGRQCRIRKACARRAPPSRK